MIKQIENQRKLILLFLVLCGCFFSINAQSDTIKPEKKSLFQHIEKWYGENMSYATITALMAVESSFIPLPSEIVIPPAAYISCSDDPEINKNNLNIFLVILFGTIGAVIGAYVNYFLALLLGRPILYKLADSKFGKLLMLSSEKVKKAEDFFNRNGKTSTFMGRLIPGVRHLISIPAGLSKMKLLPFTFFTFVGAGLWNCCLALLGYLAHGQANLINEYSHELSLVIIALVGIAIVYFVLRYFVKKNRK